MWDYLNLLKTHTKHGEKRIAQRLLFLHKKDGGGTTHEFETDIFCL